MGYRPLWDGKLKLITSPSTLKNALSVFSPEKNTRQQQMYFINRFCISYPDLNLSNKDIEILKRLPENCYVFCKNPYTLTFGEVYKVYLKCLFHEEKLIDNILDVCGLLLTLGCSSTQQLHRVLTTPNTALNCLSPYSFLTESSANQNQEIIKIIEEQGSAFIHDCVIKKATH